MSTNAADDRAAESTGPARSAGRDGATVPASPPLHRALLDSRQRWRDLVDMACDIAFEVDAAGCFVFVSPDPALGWSNQALLGQPSERLLAAPPSPDAPTPFLPQAPIRRRRVWLRRADDQLACISFAAAPLLDPQGRIIGARGTGLDMTEQDRWDAKVSAALRRMELQDHIMWKMRQEVVASHMMQSILESLVQALGAEGVAVFDLFPGSPAHVLHEAGQGAEAIARTAASILRDSDLNAVSAHAEDARPVLACRSLSRHGGQAGLALWREPGARAWDHEEHVLAANVAATIRVVLEHEAIQHEMSSQARTDPLTGLLNRRAFMAEIDRHIDRLDRDGMPGTLLFIDLDHFKQLNDQCGHDAGDEALRMIADLLRATCRPSDLIARLGGDEFAVWLNGADYLTAAERAHALGVTGMAEFAAINSGLQPALSMSIGIATRAVGNPEGIETLMRRADSAMYEAKRSGRGTWRVANAQPA